MFIVHLFVSYAHVNLCHCFSSSWYQGLATTSACGSSWTFLFTFFQFIFLYVVNMSLKACLVVESSTVRHVVGFVTIYRGEKYTEKKKKKVKRLNKFDFFFKKGQ